MPGRVRPGGTRRHRRPRWCSRTPNSRSASWPPTSSVCRGVPAPLRSPTPWSTRRPGRCPRWPPSALTDGGLVLRTAELVVTVDGEGSVRILRPDGTVLRSEAPPVRRGAGMGAASQHAPRRALQRAGRAVGRRRSARRALRLWNTDAGGSWSSGQGPLYLGIPVVRGHPSRRRHPHLLRELDPRRLLLRRTGSSPESARRCRTRRSAARRRSPSPAAFCATTSWSGDVPHLLDRYTQLTGRPGLPPRWALGYHQSRWGYKTEADVRDVVDGYRALGLPLSAVHLDIDYMDGYRVFTFDRSRFPDPGALAVGGVGVRGAPGDDRRPRGEGGRRVRRVPPGLEGEHASASTRRAGPSRGWCGPDGWRSPISPTPGHGTWWAGQYRRLTDAGIAGIWHDMNEPTSISLLGDPSLPLSTRHDFDGRGGDHGEGHNLYGLLMNRAGHEGLSAARPDRRPFIVSRSGWAGMQRWAWNWTGDVASTWESMRQQMATVIGLGLSGVPYSGPDIGGFSGVPDDELYRAVAADERAAALLPDPLGARGAPPASRGVSRSRPAASSWPGCASATASCPTCTPWPTWPPPAGRPWSVRCGGRPPTGPGARTPPGRPATTATARRRRLPPRPRPAGGAGHRSRGRRARRGAARRAMGAACGRATAAGGGGDRCSSRRPRRSHPGARARRVDRAPRRRVDRPRRRLSARRRRRPRLRHDPWRPPPGRLRLSGSTTRRGCSSFHCWPTEGGEADGMCVDDAGDGYGRVRRDTLRLAGAVPGGSAVVTWERHGDFPPPAVVRVVLHGFVADAATADGEPVATRGSSVECRPFSELRLRRAAIGSGAAVLILRRSARRTSSPRKGSTSPDTSCAG